LLSPIGDSTFEGCRSLESIRIEASLQVLGSHCFSLCRNFASITSESGSQLSSIENGAFHQRALLLSICIHRLDALARSISPDVLLTRIDSIARCLEPLRVLHLSITRSVCLSVFRHLSSPGIYMVNLAGTDVTSIILVPDSVFHFTLDRDAGIRFLCHRSQIRTSGPFSACGMIMIGDTFAT
jgi:hypothetical protein